jgi:hypothetical protein
LASKSRQDILPNGLSNFTDNVVADRENFDDRNHEEEHQPGIAMELLTMKSRFAESMS